MVLKGYLNPATRESPVLTPREREIVQLVAEGKSTKEVADKLKISPKTADTHRTNIMRKLNLHSVSELVRYAIRNKLVEP
jgi:DNA-binding CsgD family transcriptional regulator